MESLAGQIRCDCGVLHSHGKTKRVPRYDTTGVFMYRAIENELVQCECGSSHSGQVYCKCGTTWEHGPRKGWKMMKRKHARWVAIEKELRGQIADLQKQAEGEQAEAAFNALSGKVKAWKHSDGLVWIDDGRRAAWWSRPTCEWKQGATFPTGAGVQENDMDKIDIPEWFTGNAPR